MRNRTKSHPQLQSREQQRMLDSSANGIGSKASAGENRSGDPEWIQPCGRFEDLNTEALNDIVRAVPYRDAVCTLCEKTVALAFDIPLSGFHARTRCSAQVALARQIAMYLAHTIFSLLLTEIGLHFHRDRTTVSHACAMVEDKRDEFEFDVLLCQLESLLIEARNAMALSLGEIPQHAQPPKPAPASAPQPSSIRQDQPIEPERNLTQHQVSLAQRRSA